MHKDLVEIIEFQISEVDRLFEEYNLFFQDMNYERPDLLQTTVIANILHSFYNGIENILKLIIRFYDNKLPNDIKWHMELLEKAFIPNENRKNVFRNEIQEKMEEYLKFRHFVRHTYGFQLEWERMEDLINDINDYWTIIKEDIRIFVENN